MYQAFFFFSLRLCLVPHNITTELIFSGIVHSHGHHLWLHHLMNYLVIASLREAALRTQDRHQELWTHVGNCVLVGSQYSFSDSLSALPWRSASLARQPGCGSSQLPFDVPYEITQLLSLDGSSVQHTANACLSPLFGMPFFICHSLLVTVPSMKALPQPLLHDFPSLLPFHLILCPGFSKDVCSNMSSWSLWVSWSSWWGMIHQDRASPSHCHAIGESGTCSSSVSVCLWVRENTSH